MDDTSTLVLVHGAWHGPWCWEPLLSAWQPGAPTPRVVSLPTAGAEIRALGRRADDVATIRDAVERVGGPVTIVAHSAGGIPTTEAAAALPNVVGLVYLCSYMLDTDQTVFDIHDSAPDWWAVNSDEDYVDPLRPEQVFFHDVEPTLRDWAVARLRHQAIDLTPLHSAAWHTVPSAYIVCDDDRALDPSLQLRMARHAETVVHLSSGHSPFLSQPDELAKLLRDQAAHFRLRGAG